METRCRKPLLPHLMPRRGLPCWRPHSPGPMRHLPPATCSSRHCVDRSPRLRRMQFGASSEKLTRKIAQLELALEELETESAVPEIGAALSDTPVRPDSQHRPSEALCSDAFTADVGRGINSRGFVNY